MPGTGKCPGLALLLPVRGWEPPARQASSFCTGGPFPSPREISDAHYLTEKHSVRLTHHSQAYHPHPTFVTAESVSSER